jgi:CelD/BcsL family acetyltransferase involved in cellulose biosynthesis
VHTLDDAISHLKAVVENPVVPRSSARSAMAVLRRLKWTARTMRYLEEVEKEEEAMATAMERKTRRLMARVFKKSARRRRGWRNAD